MSQEYCTQRSYTVLLWIGLDLKVYGPHCFVNKKIIFMISILEADFLSLHTYYAEAGSSVTVPIRKWIAKSCQILHLGTIYNSLLQFLYL